MKISSTLFFDLILYVPKNKRIKQHIIENEINLKDWRDRMKRALSILLMLIMVCSLSITAFGSSEGQTLNDVISSQQEMVEVEDENSTADENIGTYEKNKDFINGLNEAADMASADIEGVKEVTSEIKVAAAYAVQIISYAITVFLAVSVALDLAYIGLPFIRGFLVSGYEGNKGYTDYGVGNIGTGQGLGRSIGIGQGQQQQISTGRKIQLVSDAAIQAVAAGSTLGADGKTMSPLRVYIKSMVLVLVIIPVLITLTVTGALTNLGFMIGSLLVDTISNIGNIF